MMSFELSHFCLLIFVTSLSSVTSSSDSSLLVQLLQEHAKRNHFEGYRSPHKVPETSVRPGSVIFSATKPQIGKKSGDGGGHKAEKRTSNNVKMQPVCKSISDWFPKVGLTQLLVQNKDWLPFVRRKRLIPMATRCKLSKESPSMGRW